MSESTLLCSEHALLKLRRWLSSLLLILLLIILSACGSSAALVDEDEVAPVAETEQTDEPATPAEDPASNRGQDETLRLLYWQAPTILNPHLSPGTKDLSASRITYEPLASFDKDGELVPFLAAEIPSLENGGVASDGMSVTWKLKEGVQWADGQPFTADDVLFTYEYVTNPDVSATSASEYAAVENIEVIDDHTIKINFIEPTPAWFLPFVGVQGMIIPRHVFVEYNGPNAAEAPANLAPVGTGPFRFVELRNEDILIIGGSAVSTNKIIYEANPSFREPDKPFFGKVELQGGGDLDLAVQATKEGLVDFAWTLRVSDDLLADMESAGNSVVDVSPTAFVERIMINFADPNTETDDGERANVAFPHPIFNDKRVRQAIAMAIDREALAEGRGLGARFTTNIVTQPPSIDSPDTTYKYDLEEAARLLDEAGWLDSNGDGVREKDGVELRLLFQTSIEPFRQISQEQVKRDLESIGFEVELKTIDASIFFGPTEGTTDTRRHFYADLEEFAFSNKSPDPTSYLAGWTCSETAQKENDWALSNWARYCNPEFDALFEEALTEFDVERRNDLFIAMNDLLIEDAAVLPIAQLNFPQGVNRDLKGLDITPWDVEVWNIKDWHK